MTKTKITYIAMIACSMFILVGVGLIGYFFNTPDRHDVIDVNIGADGGNESVEFEALALIPGSRTEYTVKLHAEASGDYDITIAFQDGSKELMLKKFVYAKIMVGEEIVCDKLLGELLESNEEFRLSSTLDKKDTYDISVIYYMPDTVGNEAQGAGADFKLLIKASNAEGFYE